MWKNLNLRSRLIAILLGIALLSSGILMILGSVTGTESITAEVNQRLISVRNAKAFELEGYFANLSEVVETLADQDGTGEALFSMRQAFSTITASDTINCEADLSDYYGQFTERLGKNLEIRRDIDAFYPKSATACYLQYHYIATNPHPLGEKDKLDRAAGDQSPYSGHHAHHHGRFRDIQERFGFYDIFLIDGDDFDVVYSVSKETDFATNLTYGPYRNSNLAALAKKVKRNSDLREAQVVDFDFYRPSLGIPAAFMGAPVYHNNEFVGVLAVQLPINEINAIMNYEGEWAENGLGETGEVLLLGEDYLLRSDSRLFQEDSSRFVSIMSQNTRDQAMITQLGKMGPILTIPLRGDNIDRSVAGEQGLMRVTGYMGDEVLSAYMPLNLVGGLRWSLVAEIHTDEAFRPVSRFQRLNFTALALIIVLTTILAMVITRALIRPIDRLTEGAEAVGRGDTSVRVEKTADDELGRLTEVFNDMVVSIDEQKEEIRNRTEENDALLFNRFPASIAERFKNGEQNIVDRFERVAVISCDLRGTDQFQNFSTEEAWTVVQRYADAFEQVANDIGLEVIVGIPDGYLAVCGMNIPRLDNGRRIAIAAMGLRDAVQRVNAANDMKLSYSIGVAHGSVMAGILHGESDHYMIWGPTVDQAQRLSGTGPADSIRGTSALVNMLEGNFAFDRLASVDFDPSPAFTAGHLLGRVSELNNDQADA